MNGMGSNRLFSGSLMTPKHAWLAGFQVWMTALLLAYKAHLPLCFFSFLLNALPRKWRLQLALIDIPEPLDFMDIENVFRSFLLGDRTLCSSVHILNELCSRQISLGRGIKKRRFQERHKTQEKGVLIHFHLGSYF